MTGSVNLYTDFTAPMSLGQHRAVERALELRLADPGVFTYPTIAAVIRIYHGFDRSAGWYQDRLRGRVAPRLRPHSFRSAA